MTLQPMLTMTIALPATILAKAKLQIAFARNVAILAVASIGVSHEPISMPALRVL